MNSLLNTDQYVSTRNNRHTGRAERQWIEYADGVFEPVRRDGNLNRKYHGNKRTLDWWTVDKPLDWTPADEGKQVSLNHDYGQKAQFKAEPKGAEPALDKGTAPAGQAAPSKPGDSGKSTISRGASGLWEHMAREKAEAPGNAGGGTEGQEAGEESWAYKYLVPPLWKPDGHPAKEWAKDVMKNELEEWSDPHVGFPDKIVTPIQLWGRQRKKDQK